MPCCAQCGYLSLCIKAGDAETVEVGQHGKQEDVSVLNTSAKKLWLNFV